MSISTHVLDTAKGKPASGLNLVLEIQQGQAWKEIAKGATNADGRVELIAKGAAMQAGVYRITFQTGTYNSGFYPSVTVSFEIKNPSEHYHVPLLLSPYGYSTYRGS